MSLIVDHRGLARFRGRALPCAIGRGGMSANKIEGDGCSPIGEWRIEFGYFRADRLSKPPSALQLCPIVPKLGWSDDPSDPAYNQPVPLPYTWSHERLCRGDALYDLVLVLNHNRNPAKAGQGSAIFIHCWRSPRYPTAGCLAFPRSTLLWIIENWDPRDRVVIR